MSENCRFGRRAPVERSRRSPDHEPPCLRPASGSKRSVQDRLGPKEGQGRRDKRLKGVHNQESHISNDAHLAKADLRFELIKMRDQSAGVDLRVKLSSKSNLASADGNRSPLPENPRQYIEFNTYNDNQASFSTRNNMQETMDINVDKRKIIKDSMPDVGGSSRGQYIGGFRDRVGVQSLRAVGDSVGRQARTELSDVDKQKNMEDIMPDIGGSSGGQYMLEFGDRLRVQRLREDGDSIGRQGRASVGIQSLGEHEDTYNIESPIVQGSRYRCSGIERKNIHEPWESYNGGDPNILDSRVGYDSGRQRVLEPTSLRTGQDLNIHIRRSPVRMLSSTIVRAPSSDRNLEQQRETIRRYDDDRSHLYRRQEVPGPYTAVGSPLHVRRPLVNALPAPSAVSMPFPAQFPQPIPRNQNLAGQPPIEGFLRSIGLEKYSNHFHQEEDAKAVSVLNVIFANLFLHSCCNLKFSGPRKRILQPLLPPPPPRR